MTWQSEGDYLCVHMTKAQSKKRSYVVMLFRVKEAGVPVELTRWRVYDPRARTWYREQKQRFAANGEIFGWSSVYSFSTSGALGITAMSTFHDVAGVQGIAAIDYTLAAISNVISDELIAEGEDRSHVGLHRGARWHSCGLYY